MFFFPVFSLTRFAAVLCGFAPSAFLGPGFRAVQRGAHCSVFHPPRFFAELGIRVLCPEPRLQSCRLEGIAKTEHLELVVVHVPYEFRRVGRSATHETLELSPGPTVQMNLLPAERGIWRARGRHLLAPPSDILVKHRADVFVTFCDFLEGSIKSLWAEEKLNTTLCPSFMVRRTPFTVRRCSVPRSSSSFLISSLEMFGSFPSYHSHTSSVDLRQYRLHVRRPVYARLELRANPRSLALMTCTVREN